MAPVFRHYDQSRLDREYDNRAKVSNFQEFLENYRNRSEALRKTRQHRPDLPYGEHPAARLNLFSSAQTGDGPAPVHVFIHGGYWKSLGKDDFDFTAAAAPGAITVVLEYPLIPTVTMDQLVEECRRGLIWIYQHISEFGGDPGRIVVSGHSAGGHLAALLLATPWATLDPALPTKLVKGILALSGLYDLEPIRRCFLNAELQLDATMVATHSPIHHRPPPGAIALLAVGDQEGEEYNRQSRDLATAWESHTTVRVISTPDHHFSIVSQLGAPDTPLARHLQTLLEDSSHAIGPE